MTNIFRKAAIVAIAMVTMSMAANAQVKGDKAAGANIVFGSGDSYSNIGIGAKFQYNVTDPIRLEGSFTYFLEKDYVSMWDLSVNGHWLFPVADQITVYPLAGLSILGSKVNFGGLASASNSELGVNLGGGIDYKLNSKTILNAELKYKAGDHWNRLLLSAGVAFLF